MQRTPPHPLETLLTGAGVPFDRPLRPGSWLAAQASGTLERLWADSLDARALVALAGPTAEPRALLSLACGAARALVASIPAEAVAALEAAEDWTRGACSLDRLEAQRDALRARHEPIGSWELGLQDGGPRPLPAAAHEPAWRATNAVHFALAAILWVAAPTLEPMTHLVTQVGEVVHWSRLAAEAAAAAARREADPTLEARSRRSSRQRVDKLTARAHADAARRFADLVRLHLNCPSVAALST